MRERARVLLPDLVANLRDAGGLMTGAQMTGARMTVRPGRLFRSAALAWASPAALDTLTGLIGPALCLDLRTDTEVERDGDGAALVARGWTWERIPLRDTAPGQAGPCSPRRRYEQAAPGYTHVACAVARRVRAEARPAVVCCSLGKDRTGIVTALLLDWLGVARADIAADYELSNACLAGQRRLLPARWRDGAAEIQPVAARDCRTALALAEAEVAGRGAKAPPMGLRAEIAALRASLLAPDGGTGGLVSGWGQRRPGPAAWRE